MMRAVGTISIGALALSALMLSVTSPGFAQARRAGPAPDFHGRDFARFAPRERNIWARGHWINDWHGPRYGWWWVVGDAWYFYPRPIYPYPMYVPPAIVEQQAPPTPVGLPPAENWYFCDNPQGYYPYVASCNGPWRSVPTTPPPPPPRS
jgi:hypothetical protein